LGRHLFAVAAVCACAPTCDFGYGGQEAAPGDAPPSEAGAAGIDFAALSPGDSLLGLRIDSLSIRPDPVDGFGWMGTVDFSGSVELAGAFRPHMDFPDVRETCFFVDDSLRSRLPRFPNDVRRSWFCFTNPAQAEAVLGVPGDTARARIRIDRFYYHYRHTDVYNRARLVSAGVLP
jgi:hypothetical protein